MRVVVIDHVSLDGVMQGPGRPDEDMLGHWNAAGGPFEDGLDNTLKYLASADPTTELVWPRSTLLSGDVPAEVAALRDRPGGNLVVLGSGRLVRSLLPHGLVDELLLLIHPVVLGSGQRLFGADDQVRAFELASCVPTPSGLLVAACTA